MHAVVTQNRDKKFDLAQDGARRTLLPLARTDPSTPRQTSQFPARPRAVAVQDSKRLLHTPSRSKMAGITNTRRRLQALAQRRQPPPHVVEALVGRAARLPWRRQRCWHRFGSSSRSLAISKLWLQLAALCVDGSSRWLRGAGAGSAKGVDLDAPWRAVDAVSSPASLGTRRVCE